MSSQTVPADIWFTKKQFSIHYLAELLENGTLGYNSEAVLDAKILEFIVLSSNVTYNLLFRADPSLDKHISEDSPRCFPGYSVYCGHGLIKAINNFIVQDQPLTDLFIMKEWEGKRFSELGYAMQRRIKEYNVNIIVDSSFYNTNSNQVSDEFLKVLKAIV